MVWYTALDGNGTTYYWNETGQSTYEKPADFEPSSSGAQPSSAEVRSRVEVAAHEEIQTCDVNQALRLKDYDQIHRQVSENAFSCLMEEKRTELTIILAGYKDDMEQKLF